MNLDNNRNWLLIMVALFGLSFTLSSSRLEQWAVMAEVLCIWTLAKEKTATFPIGMISTTLFFFIFLEAELYGSVLLQVYFFIMNAIGWYMWTHGSGSSDVRKTRALSIRGWFFCLVALAVLPLGFQLLLQYYMPIELVFLDVFLTVLCMIASLLTSYKILENWYGWIACECLYFFLYFQHELYLAMLMSAITLILNTQGLSRWKRKMEAVRKDNPSVAKR